MFGRVDFSLNVNVNVNININVKFKIYNSKFLITELILLIRIGEVLRFYIGDILSNGLRHVFIQIHVTA